MKNRVLLYLMGLAGVLMASPVFAQGPGGHGSHADYVALTSGFAMAIAAGLCGLGQGRAAAGACEGVARNPGARPAISFFLILAFIFIESLALYTLAIIFVKVV